MHSLIRRLLRLHDQNFWQSELLLGLDRYGESHQGFLQFGQTSIVDKNKFIGSQSHPLLLNVYRFPQLRFLIKSRYNH